DLWTCDVAELSLPKRTSRSTAATMMRCIPAFANLALIPRWVKQSRRSDVGSIALALILLIAFNVGLNASEIPTDLLACGPYCRELLPSAFMIDCRDELGHDMFWTDAWDRSWYGPLRYVGPIEVAVQARPWGPPEQPLPLFIGIRRDPRAVQCI